MFESVTATEPQKLNAVSNLNKAFSALGPNYLILMLATLLVFGIQVVLQFLPYIGFILAFLATPLTAGLVILAIDAADGKPLDFTKVFSGFSKFGSIIAAALLMAIPFILLYGLFVIGFASLVQFDQVDANGAPDFGAMIIPLLLMVVIGLVFGVIASLFLFFPYHLIMDKDLNPIDAIKISARAGSANLGQMFIMIIIWGIIFMLGLAACYIGLIFTAPIGHLFGAFCYREMFPADELTPTETGPPSPDAYQGMMDV